LAPLGVGENPVSDGTVTVKRNAEGHVVVQSGDVEVWVGQPVDGPLRPVALFHRGVGAAAGSGTVEILNLRWLGD